MRILLILFLALPLLAQSPETVERGSIIEDRAARKLLQAGDARLEVGENEKALVRAGQISNGMSKSAVWLAWGEPAGKSYGQSGRARTEQWIYRSYQPVYTQSFYGSNYGHYYDCGYGYSGLGFGLGVNYVPVPSAKVDFENDRVVAWARGDRR